MKIYEEECHHAGIDPKKLSRIVKRMAKCMGELHDLDKDLGLFGGTWNATIRHRDCLILASMDECRTSGGCGAEDIGPDGLLRGER